MATSRSPVRSGPGPDETAEGQIQFAPAGDPPPSKGRCHSVRVPLPCKKGFRFPSESPLPSARFLIFGGTPSAAIRPPRCLMPLPHAVSGPGKAFGYAGCQGSGGSSPRRRPHAHPDGKRLSSGFVLGHHVAPEPGNAQTQSGEIKKPFGEHLSVRWSFLTEGRTGARMAIPSAVSPPCIALERVGFRQALDSLRKGADRSRYLPE